MATLETLLGGHPQWVQGIETGATKCRLIFENQRCSGALAYQNKLIDGKLEITHLSPLSTTVLEELLEMGQELKPRSVSIYVDKTEAQALKFFKAEGFRETADSDASSVRLEKSLVAKRKHEESPPVQSAVPSRRPFFKAARKTQALEATLKDPYLGQIERGEKTVEGRINAGMFFGIQAGSEIRFFNHRSSVTCSVLQVNRYSSFNALLETEGFKKCIPSARSLEDAKQIYDRIPGYAQRAAQSGVLAIQIQVKQ